MLNVSAFFSMTNFTLSLSLNSHFLLPTFRWHFGNLVCRSLAYECGQLPASDISQVESFFAWTAQRLLILSGRVRLSSCSSLWSAGNAASSDAQVFLRSMCKLTLKNVLPNCGVRRNRIIVGNFLPTVCGRLGNNLKLVLLYQNCASGALITEGNNCNSDDHNTLWANWIRYWRTLRELSYYTAGN